MVNLCQTYTKQTQKVDTDMVDTQLQTKKPALARVSVCNTVNNFS